MLHGVERSFFPESKGYLGQLANAELAQQPCVIKRFVEEKQRWAVQLLHPRFRGKQVLVSEDKLAFDGYAAPSSLLKPLPGHLGEAVASTCGKALFCNKDLCKGELVLEESPFMVVGNEKGPMESRWNLYTRTLHEEGGSSPVAQAFEGLSDGGIVERMVPDATALFREILERSSKPPELKRMMLESDEARGVREREITRIAGVMARWQTNGHAFRPKGEESKEGQSALYRFFARMLHSCEPNCSRTVSMETGCMSVQAARFIRRGELLTIDYEGRDEHFLQRPVEKRRKQLLARGFVCVCTRCMRESGEVLGD